MASGSGYGCLAAAIGHIAVAVAEHTEWFGHGLERQCILLVIVKDQYPHLG